GLLDDGRERRPVLGHRGLVHYRDQPIPQEAHLQGVKRSRRPRSFHQEPWGFTPVSLPSAMISTPSRTMVGFLKTWSKWMGAQLRPPMKFMLLPRATWAVPYVPSSSMMCPRTRPFGLRPIPSSATT